MEEDPQHLYIQKSHAEVAVVDYTLKKIYMCMCYSISAISI